MFGGSCSSLPADKVQVILTPVMGGGFGSKFGPGRRGRAVALRRSPRQLVRPVHLMLDRPQEFQMAGNRSGTKAKLKRRGL